jgi:hypothetical protein
MGEEGRDDRNNFFFKITFLLFPFYSLTFSVYFQNEAMLFQFNFFTFLLHYAHTVGQFAALGGSKYEASMLVTSTLQRNSMIVNEYPPPAL